MNETAQPSEVENQEPIGDRLTAALERLEIAEINLEQAQKARAEAYNDYRWLYNQQTDNTA